MSERKWTNVDAMRGEVAFLRSRVAAMEEFIEKVFQHWSFNSDQRHTHTWHTREDLREEWFGIKTGAKQALEGAGDASAAKESP